MLLGRGASMETILIDKEQTVLNVLQKKIAQLSNIKVLGAFTDPHEGLIEVSKKQPDVLFLDISIPEVNWIKVATQLKKTIPEMKIVFLAAVDKYALEAFDVQADDYLLKPVDGPRLTQTISKMKNQIEKKKQPYQPMINCFQNLHFRYQEKAENITDVHWRTSKAREVFAYLVHNRGELVRKDVLIDFFWPDLPLKEAFSQLYSAIYQMRRTMKAIKFDVQIMSQESSYRLELNHCLVDVDVWENGIKAMPLITAKNIEAHKNLLFLYKGGYFEEENYLWAINERNRLRVKWIHQMKRVVNYCLTHELYGEAIVLYLYYQKINPFISESYFELMKLYALFDDRYAVEEQYQLVTQMFEEEFGTEPDEEIVSWYENWMRY